MTMRNEIIIGAILSAFFFFGAYRSAAQYKPFVPTPPTTPASNTRIPASNITLTKDVVALHNTSADCWMIVDNTVYNVTTYLPYHPGGPERIIPFCGNDGTNAFATQGGKGSHSQSANTDLQRLLIGTLGTTLDQSTLKQREQQTTAITPALLRKDREQEKEDD